MKVFTQTYIKTLMLAMLIVLALPCGALTLQQMKTQGVKLTKEGRYAEALPLLERVVKANKRNTVQWELAICRQNLYNYKGALESLEIYRSMQRKNANMSKIDSLQELCQIGLRGIKHVQDVVIIDSMVVEKSDFLSYYRLGPESGSVLLDSDGSSVFESQTGTYRLSVKEGVLHEAHKIKGVWESWEPLEGIGSAEFRIDYPWMMSDGETLYFSTDSVPGFGGMDIYKTRYNSDDNTFYEPERLGMPFNSTGNDYMMALDELHNVGWWATDRNSPEDSVTIYIYIVDDIPSYISDPKKSVERAIIKSIKQTWKEDDYNELLTEIRNADQSSNDFDKLSIVIGPNKVYHSLSDFKNRNAAQVYEQSVIYEDMLADIKLLLEEQRARYQAGKKSIGNAILENEAKVNSLTQEVRSLQKEYRRLENQ